MLLKIRYLLILMLPLFSHCWYHPQDLFNYSHSDVLQIYESEADIPLSELTNHPENFKNSKSKNIYLKSRKPLWLKVRLADLDQSRGHDFTGQYFEFQSNFINEIELYFPVRSQTLKTEYLVITTGKDIHPDLRDSSFRNYLVKIPENVNRNEDLYIRFKSDLSLTFQVLYHTKNFYERRLRIDNYYFGIIFGILFAMLIYNIFVLIALRSKTYLYYVLHIFSVIIFLLNLYGQLWILFESLYGQYVKILWLSGAFIIIFSSQFVRHFLRIKDFSPKLDRLMSSLVLLGFALFVSGLFEFYTFANYTARLTALILPLIYVAAGIQASRKGFKSAGLLFISWIMISVAFCGLAAKGLELPMIHYLSLVSLPAAFAIESVLYSIALANQLRILQEEKEEAIQYGKRFEEMSYTDPLTGFFNRRYFESKLQAEILHSKLMNRPLGLILLDFDNFKMINDTYGHAQGDEVLKQLSKTLLENKRREDTFCRYGGEEFACLLPGSDLQASANIAEKMRKKCESIIFTPKAFIHFKVTVSAGVTTFYPEDTDDTLLERADRLMYKAKESGKNTVVTDQVEPQE